MSGWSSYDADILGKFLGTSPLDFQLGGTLSVLDPLQSRRLYTDRCIFDGPWHWPETKLRIIQDLTH